MQTSGKILYRSGYKYQLANDWWVQTSILGVTAVIPDRVDLGPDGRLTVRAGYAWDGPSGPTWDTKDFMRGSLAHDALYQLMREGHLNSQWREAADQLLYDLCREDGMGWFRAWYVRAAVRKLAAYAAKQRVTTPFEAP